MDNSNFGQLAIEGGRPARQNPFGIGNRHGEEEKRLLQEVVDSDILFYYFGTKVRELELQFAQLYNVKHVVACSSGTAAVHMAIAALNIPAGREVIVPAITDMGTVTGILYQGLVPVFADVDSATLNIDPESIRRAICSKTGAIVAVHHAGLACDIDSIIQLGTDYGIPVVEDCAQAYYCETKGRLVGSLGTISAFSLNHFKHITCGSGGMMATNDDGLRYRASLFLDKCFQREEGIRNPFFLAPNYQMTELQGAVALAQIKKVAQIVGQRNKLGERLNEKLRDVPGITIQEVPEYCRHVYFMYLFRLDPNVVDVDVDEFSAALKAEGVPNQARQITGGRPIYLYDVFQKRSAFPGTEWPFSPTRIYRKGDCPIAESAFDQWVTMSISEHYSQENIDEIASGITKVALHFNKRPTAPLTVEAGSLLRHFCA